MAISPRRRRRPYGLIVLLLALLGGVGYLLEPMLRGEPIRDPLGIFAAGDDAEDDEVAPPAEGMVRVLVSGRTIPAYTRVSRDDFFDVEKGRFATVDLPKASVEATGVLAEMGAILGRVMSRKKRPGYAFTEADFLPKGTRPGLAAGVPNGKRALRIKVDYVHGIIGLNPGDRFDLIAARMVADSSGDGGAPDFAQFYRGVSKPPTGSAPREKRARVDVIVQNGIIVSGLETRQQPTTTASLTAGQRTSTRPVQEMVIALAPDEVAPLTAALANGSEITCVARSGRPGESELDLTPGYFDEPSDESGPDESPEVHFIESIQGGERTFLSVPRRASENPDEGEEGESNESQTDSASAAARTGAGDDG